MRSVTGPGFSCTSRRGGFTLLEVLIAPGYTEDAIKVIAQKKNVRVLEVALSATAPPQRDLKRIGGPESLKAYTRNVRLSLFEQAHAVFMEVPK